MACSSLGVTAALFLSSSLGVVDAFSISAAPLSGTCSASSASSIPASIGRRRGADMGVPATMPPSLSATALHATSDPDRPADSLVGVHGGGGADGGTSSRRRRTTGNNNKSKSNSSNKSNKRRAANASSTRGGASPASQSPAKNRRSNNANNQGDRRRRRNDHPSQGQRAGSRATASAAEAQRRNREQRLALRSKLEEMQRRSGQGEELSREFLDTYMCLEVMHG